MAPIRKLFYAINFLQRPYWTTDELAVVPSKWVSYVEKQAMVAFPLFDKKMFASYVRKRRSPYKSWPVFPVTLEYKSDLYQDTALYVKFRQQMRSSYVTCYPLPVTVAAVSKQMAANHDIQFVEAPPTTLYDTKDSISFENSSSVTASETEALEASHPYPPGASLSEVQIEKKAMKHELLMTILYKFNEVNRLLDDYNNLK